jgi:hypothetical protein
MAVLVAEYAEVLRESYWAQESTLAGVLEEAERVIVQLPRDSNFNEFLDLLERAAQMAIE